MKALNSLAIFLSTFFVFGAVAFSQSPCPVGVDERVWVGNAMTTWTNIRKNSLGLPSAKLPWLLLFNETCVIHINPDSDFLKRGPSPSTPTTARFGSVAAKAMIVSHGGKINLPDGAEVPVGLLSFAATFDQGRASFLISALPAVWQKAPHLQNEPNIDKLAASVFVHEMTHTLHRHFYDRLVEIEKQKRTEDEIDDDLIQKRFEKIEEFRALIESERKLLYDAASQPSRAEKKRLAAIALKAIEQRRDIYFRGENAEFAEIEDIFLTMEGVANWAAFKAAMEQGLGRPEALKLIRRGGKYWSQDIGLALFLVIDDLMPGWQKRAFAKRNATVYELMRDAVK
ncbi:MAG: hypothetical protein K1X36_01450 [Pyrinomonadaceae bacterium]|nr:hypothetical protein [Pyrinomonadaceae bacterium]